MLPAPGALIAGSQIRPHRPPVALTPSLRNAYPGGSLCSTEGSTHGEHGRRQAEMIREAAERLGRQGAELERATSTVVVLGDEFAAAEATRRRDMRLLVAAAALLACLALMDGAFAVTAGWLREHLATNAAAREREGAVSVSSG